MDDVLAKAADLGRAVRATPKFQALRDAEAAVLKSPDSVKLAEAYATLQQERAKAEKSGKPVDAGLQDRFDKISAAVALDPRLLALSRAQQEFQDLVSQVSRTMLGELKT
jgi:cell fate (sporulation/competence/biofilm development) regulator YlbF (YheA/YmcA/DUF963 family)